MGPFAYSIAATVVALLLNAPELARDSATLFPPKDFIEYWSAARVHLAGGDPYDGGQLIPLQRQVDGEPYKTKPTMLWTPPWTLPLYWPFGALDPKPAHFLWVLIQVLTAIVASVLTWRAYGGHTTSFWLLVPFLLAVTFGPVWWLIGYGQNTAFVLLGVAGFLYFRTKGYPLAAGLIVALTAIKPHLLAIFGLAMILEGTTRPGRRVLLGGIVTIILASLLALIPNREIFRDFIEAFRRPNTHTTPSVTEWALPLVSYKLRVWIDDEQFRLQFIPIAVLAVLLVPYWWIRRQAWDWSIETPRLVFASLLAAPYGGWIFDLTILLVPVIQAFVAVTRMPRSVPMILAAFAHLMISAATILIPTFLIAAGHSHGLHDFLWVTPVVLFWCFLVTRMARSTVEPARP